MDEAAPEGCLIDGEAVDLLEEYWFFGNLLRRENKRAIMLRCFSDPCPSADDMLTGDRQSSSSSSPSPRKMNAEGIAGARADSFRTPPLVLREEARDEPERVRVDDGTPEEVPVSAELPPSIKKGVQERKCDPKEGSLDEHKQPPRPVLLRAPSLPPCIGRDEAFEGRESFPRMIKPSRQASLNLSEFLPPRHTPKGMTQSASMSKYRQPKFTDAEKSAIAFNKEMRRRYLTRSNSRKSLSDLADEEVRGFKELGFSFEEKHLNRNIVSILPGLQEKTQENEDGNGNEGPYLSEEWLAQSYAPTVPKWNAKGRSPEDMKAQIKFWARVVASNVRQEC
ncbi:hypothetical protein BT93_F2620 [Corymbia citriodora subsp. variegata]|nr:hypothetical protein BT93_F2620 [Corymbia citriodora subsp. variegata]